MFITVLHADNERTLFNIHCKISVLLDSIRSRCHCENEVDIDLVDENAEVKNLPDKRDEYASKVLREREEYALVSIRSKLRSKGGARALGIQPQRKKTKTKRKSTLS